MEIPSAEQSVNMMVSSIHQIAASHAAPEISLGKVLKPLPNIEVSYNGIILTKDDLFVDQFLLKKYSRAAKGDLQQKDEHGDFETGNAKGNLRTITGNRRGGWGKPSFISHMHKISNSYKADMECNFESNSTSKYKDSIIYRDWGINTGDLVTLLPINGGQQFVITGKVAYCKDLKAEDFSDVEEW